MINKYVRCFTFGIKKGGCIVEKNDQRMKKIKFFGAGHTLTSILWWISFFFVLWLQHNGRVLNNVEYTIYAAFVFVLIVAGVIFKELQRYTAGEDTDKRMKSLTKAYIGVWGVWIIADIWFTVWGIYMEQEIFIPYMVITLAVLLILAGINLARNSTFP